MTLPDESALPEGAFRQGRVFLQFFFLHLAAKHFASRYLFPPPFTLLRRKLLQDSFRALSCAADGFSGMEEKGDDPERRRILFSRSGEFFEEFAADCIILLKMKKFRIFREDDPLMDRFRALRIRSLDAFRDWISMERFDSDCRFESMTEEARKKEIFYPSSAELAANGLFLLGKQCARLARRLSR